MHLHGKVLDNLRAAVTSAAQLQGRHVYRDTLDYWRALIAHAIANKQRIRNDRELEALVRTLQSRLDALLSQSERAANVLR
jgi:hypothetical protein